MTRGVLHVHSAYSDGELTLPQLRRALLGDGYAFACLTDHAEYFSAASLATFTAECRALSDAQFCFVPGLEFRCDNAIHVLGLGVTELLDSTDVATVLRHI